MILLGVAIVWTPFLLLVLALVVARLTGCEIDEAGARPCRVAGLDVGRLLHRMMVMGWLVIPLLPFMALTLIGGVVAGVAALSRAVPVAGRPCAEWGRPVRGTLHNSGFVGSVRRATTV